MMKKEYNKPEFNRREVYLEHSIVSASIDTKDSTITIEGEDVIEDTHEWNFDLE